MGGVAAQAAHALAPGPEPPQGSVGHTLDEPWLQMHVHRRFHLRRDCTTIPTNHHRNRSRRGLKMLAMITGVAVAGLLVTAIAVGLLIGLLVLAFG